MAKTFLIKTKDGTTYGPYTLEDAKAANMASQVAIKGDQYIEIPQPAVKPGKQPTGKPTTGGPQPTQPTPPSLPIPDDGMSMVPLPPQTGPDPLFKQKEALAKEYASSERGFLGGLADGISLGTTLDDVSRVEEEGSPVAYGGGEFTGEAVANLLAEAGLVAAKVPPQAAAAIAGALTGGVKSAMESKQETGEVQLGPTIGGAVGGAAGGAAGAFIGAPMMRRKAAQAGGAIAGLLGKEAKPITTREAKELAARGMKEEVGSAMAAKEAKKTEKELGEKAAARIEQRKANIPEVERPKGYTEFIDELDNAGLSGEEWEQYISAHPEFKKYRDYLDKVITQDIRHFRTKEQVEKLINEIANLDTDILAKKKLYASQLKRLSMPDNLKQYAMEYWDQAIGGAIGAAGAMSAPSAYERAKEEAGRYAGQVSGTPVNQSIRQKQAMEALQRMAEAQAAEEEQKKKRGKAVRVWF